MLHGTNVKKNFFEYLEEDECFFMYVMKTYKWIEVQLQSYLNATLYRGEVKLKPRLLFPPSPGQGSS